MTAFHPSARLPTWAAVAIVAAAYVVRSVLRGFDFRPDLPWDAIIFAVLLALLALRAALRRRGWEPPAANEDGRDDHGDEDEPRRSA